MDYLRQIDPGNPHPILIYLSQEEMLIGRHTVLSLANFSQVSRYHACFTKNKGSWYVKDLGSEYDLFVNFTSIGRSNLKLELGDIIGFGTATLNCKDGGFVCVLKSRMKQEDENTHEAGEPSFCVGLSAHPKPSPDAVSTPRLKREVLENISMNCESETQSTWNWIESIGKDRIYPLTPPRLSQAPSIKNERVEQSPCSTVSENAKCSEGYSSDVSLRILYETNTVPSYNSIDSYRLKGRKPKREYDSEDSVCTEPAFSVLHSTELDSPCRSSRSIENALNYNEMECDASSVCKQKLVPDFLHCSTNNDFSPSITSVCSFSDERLMEVMPSENELSVDKCIRHCMEENRSPTDDVFTQCYVKLIPCDSEYFEWPSDVRPFRVAVKQSRYSLTNPSQDDESSSNSEAFERRIHPKETTRLLLSRKLKIKVKNNKIISSDSDETDNDLESCSLDCSSELTTESDLFDKRVDSSESESICDEGRTNIRQLPKRRTRLQSKTSKRLELSRSDDSDSSVSSHSEILFPSSDVIKQIESAAAASRTSTRECSQDHTAPDSKKRRTLLTEPQPIKRRPGRRERYRSQDSHSSPLQETVPKSSSGIAATSIETTPTIGNRNDSHCGRGQQTHLQEYGSGEEYKGKNHCLEGTCPVKVRKKGTVPRRPYSFGSRMGFLLSMEENGGKSTETRKESPHSRAKTRKNVRIPPQDQVSGDVQVIENVLTQKNSSKTKVESSNQAIRTYSDKRIFTVAQSVSTPENSAVVSKPKDMHKPPGSVSEVQTTGHTSSTDSGETKNESINKRAFRKSSNEGNFSVAVNSTAAPKQKKTFENESDKLRSDPECKTISPVPQTLKNVPYSFDSNSVIEKLVYWNPKWLVEQKGNENPPPAVLEGAAMLPLTFDSYKSYASSFLPMIVIDVWQSLFDTYQETARHPKAKWNAFYYCIHFTENKPNVLVAHCHAVVNDTFSYRPSEGEVVLLNTGNVDPTVNSCLVGYIYRHSVEKFNFTNRSLTKWSAAMPAEWIQDARFWRFSVFVKKLRQPLQRGSVNIGHGMLNIRERLRLADGLAAFRASPLQKEVVRPSPGAFFVPDLESDKSSTERIAAEMAAEMRPKSPAKLFLLHGPAGTGKTEVVVMLLRQLAATANSKVLVCAPCDSALDEIALRLVRFNDSSIRLVRIGTWPGIHFDLYQYSLYRITHDLRMKENQQRESEIQDLQNAINWVLFTDKGMGYRKRVDNNALQVLMNKYKRLKKQAASYCDLPQLLLERKVLNESNVIFSTLENLQPALLDGISFTCCIVDASTQCTEPELLHCLTPGVGKLVLMGDCQQLLPRVKSSYAFKCGYGRSLFERLCLFFKQQYSVVPFLTLKNQYRMRPEICRFPSKYFYNGALVTGEDRFQNSPFRPVVMYDVMTDALLGYADERASQVIAYICLFMLQVDPSLSIGVIGNTNEEMAEYVEALANLNLRCVEVSVLEDYQGREKDVVIWPYIRQPNQSDDNFASERRLNVAVTRARQCLILLGHISYLMHYTHWRALIDEVKCCNRYVGVAFLRDIPFNFPKTIVSETANAL